MSLAAVEECAIEETSVLKLVTARTAADVWAIVETKLLGAATTL